MAQESLQGSLLLPDAFGPPPNGPEPSWIENCTFTDMIWYTTGQDRRPITLDFTLIPDAYRLTCKYLLWALEYEADTRANTRRLHAVASFQRYFYEFRALTLFVEKEQINGLAMISDIDIRRYVNGARC